MKKSILPILFIFLLPIAFAGLTNDSLTESYECEGNIADSESNYGNLDGTNVSAAWNTGIVKIGNASCQYTGSSYNQLDINVWHNARRNQSGTVNWWAYIDADIGNNQFFIDFGQLDSFRITDYDNNASAQDAFAVALYYGGVGRIDALTSNAAIQYGVWHMYTLAWNASQFDLYYDDTLNATWHGAVGIDNQSGQSIWLGAGVNGAPILGGEMDAIKIFNLTANLTDVINLYNNTAGLNTTQFHEKYSVVSGGGASNVSGNIVVANNTYFNSSVNFTSDGGKHCGWNTSVNSYNSCGTTADTTPTFTFNTVGDSECRLSSTAVNYTNSNSTFNCATTGSTSHVCTYAESLTDGVKTLYATCKSSAFEMNNFIQGNNFNITIDTTPPTFNITSPNNGSKYTATSIPLNIAVGSTDVSEYFYILNNMTMVKFTPNTTITARQAQNNITVFANDTVGNGRNVSVNFSVDSVAPVLTVSSPINNTLYAVTNISLNASAADNNTLSFWYSLNLGANTTFTPNSSFLGIEGRNNISIFANDSYGNSAGLFFNFSVDDKKPNVTIQSPVSGRNYTQKNISLNVSASDEHLSTFFYSINYGANLTFVPNDSVNFLEDINLVYIYVNDTAGNLNVSFLNFTVDTIKPSVVIQSPVSGRNYTQKNISLNVSANDTRLSSFFYSINTGINRTFVPNDSINFSENINLVFVYVNDTVGNVNTSFLNFTVDTIKPNITIQHPVNNTIYLISNQSLNVSANDTNLAFFAYTLNRGNLTVFTPNTSILGTEGLNNITITVNDSFGNIENKSISFTIDTVAPSHSNISVTPASSQSFTETLNIFFNITWTEANPQTAILSVSSINYTMSKSGNNYNATIIGLGAGTHTYYFWANDSANRTNQTQDFTYLITPKPDYGGGGGGGGVYQCYGSGIRCSRSSECCSGLACSDSVCSSEGENATSGTNIIADFVNGTASIADLEKESRKYLPSDIREVFRSENGYRKLSSYTLFWMEAFSKKFFNGSTMVLLSFLLGVGYLSYLILRQYSSLYKSNKFSSAIAVGAFYVIAFYFWLLLLFKQYNMMMFIATTSLFYALIYWSNSRLIRRKNEQYNYV